MSAPAWAHVALLALVVGGVVLGLLGEQGDERLAAIVGGAIGVLAIGGFMVGLFSAPSIPWVP